jgi:MFS family permease
MNLKKSGITRDIVLLSIAIFFSDMSNSTSIPIFPGYAQSLGASLSMIGSFSSVAGVASLLIAVPLGRLSDKYGRRTLMIPGLMMLALVPATYIFSTNPLHFYPIRIMYAIACGMIFTQGFLLMTEISEPGIRSTAQGLYMTCMGLGFTIGPLIGGYAAKYYGVTTSFVASSIFAFLGLISVTLVKENKQAIQERKQAKLSFRDLAKDTKILVGCMSNFLNSMMFNAMMLFFPVFGKTNGFDEAQIGVGLTVRGAASTVVRLPVGALAKNVKVYTMMLAGILISGASIYGLSNTTLFVGMTALLGLQGVAYGVFLTAGNIYIADESPKEMRGTAMGLYNMFGSISNIINPLILGFLADFYGIKGAFQFTAIVSVVGMVLLFVLNRKNSSPVLAA